MISLLASLENLRYLILPRADDCGLPHLQSNPEFRVLMRNSEKTVTPACHDIAKALFSAHPHLKCIWFDSIIFRTSFRRVDRAVAVRDSQGVAVGLNVYEESSLHTTWHRLIRWTVSMESAGFKFSRFASDWTFGGTVTCPPGQITFRSREFTFCNGKPEFWRDKP